MNVLFLTPYVPDRLRARSRSLILGLLEHGHRVTVATPIHGVTDASGLDELRAAGATLLVAPLSRWRVAGNVLATIPRRTPFQASVCWSPALLDGVRRHLQRGDTDVIHIEHLRAARYVEALAGDGIALVWDSVDCISALLERAGMAGGTLRGRLMAWLDLSRTREFEARMLELVRPVLVTSPAERQALVSLVLDPGARREREAGVEVLCHGIDTAALNPDAAPRRPDTVIFSGKMSYHANLAAARRLVREIMPLVWRARPGVVLELAGAAPPASLRRLARHARGRVQVTGRVGHLAPHLAGATVAVAPLAYGVGVQNKVLEAYACGTPVVATPVAMAGLPPGGREHLIVADTDAAIADAVLALLADERSRRRRGREARRWVHENVSRRQATARLEEIYDRALRRRGGTTGPARRQETR